MSVILQQSQSFVGGENQNTILVTTVVPKEMITCRVLPWEGFGNAAHVAGTVNTSPTATLSSNVAPDGASLWKVCSNSIRDTSQSISKNLLWAVLHILSLSPHRHDDFICLYAFLAQVRRVGMQRNFVYLPFFHTKDTVQSRYLRLLSHSYDNHPFASFFFSTYEKQRCKILVLF